jgi:hypothetical protein
MKNFIVNIMSVALEVIMWITLIACAIAGLIISQKSFDTISPGLGFVIGVFVGMFINICVWGVISILVEIRNYVKEIAERRK